MVGDFLYPHGEARANYVQYLADALVHCGYKVVILGKINSEFCNEMEFSFRNVTIKEIEQKGGNRPIRRLCNGRRGFKFYFKHYLEQFKPCEDDVFITFGGEFIRLPVRTLRDKYGFKLISCPLEWFGREQYASEEQYSEKQKEFNMIHKCDAVFPISHNIAREFSELPQLIIPPLVDIAESKLKEKKSDCYNIILPANGMMKDAFESMIKGFSLLTDEELKKVNFHIKGVKKEKIIDCIGEKQWDRIKKRIFLHHWMKYDELVSLYEKMHFLILARDVNQMTQSNFPSKVPETMAYGIVPIVSRVGDYTKYYLKDEINSFIFDGCTAKDCCNAYKKAIETEFDRYNEMSRESRKCVEEKFDYRNWIDPLKNFIEDLFV